ncbi:MAG: UvrD-helicase domain-containing protein, partial [Acidimicrobiales bacterium]
MTFLLDGDARQLVATALDRSLFVEAGAGTGKTTALVGRIVRLVATGRVREVSGLVAITFTEAAAAELRDRIREALEAAAASGDLPPSERERCATAVRRIDEASITTLHGFAQRILAEHPLEAGLPPGFEVEEGIAAELANESRWAKLRDSLLGDPDLEADLELGLALGLTLHQLHDVTRLLHDRWDRLRGASPAPVAPATLDPTIALAEVEAAVAIAVGRTDIDFDDKLMQAVGGEAARWAAGLREAVETDDQQGVARLLAAAPLTGWKGGSAKVWGADDKALVRAHMEAGITAAVEMVTAARRAVLERVLPRLVADTLAAADARRRAGRLHFHDLLVLARDLLWADDPTVRRTLAGRIDVVLVDEFQDTDPLQIEVVAALAGVDTTVLPARWEDVRLAPGRVMVVGDPKQSIYGFRGADITLWAKARDVFDPVDIVALTRNFRTVPRILDWVNATFAGLLAGRDDLQPGYVALDAHRQHIGPDLPVVVVGGPAEGVRAPEVRAREATELSRVVAAMKAGALPVDDPAAPGGSRSVRFDDVAVLVPSRTPIGALERALDAADIPYRIESRSLVWATDVVRELLAVLRAVEDPSDAVAVVAALRSPGFGCSDDDLASWRRAGGRWDPRADPPADVAADDPVARGLAGLRRLHDRRWWVPVDELADTVVRELRLVALTLVQQRPRDHHRRLRFVVDQAGAFVEAGGRSLAAFLRWAALQEEQGATAVEVVVPEHDDDAVRILTVHGSKGLEFPVVILAGLGTRPPVGGARVLWGGHGAEVAFGAKARRFATGGFDALADVAVDADVAESHRLLYVAATRARDHLVVSCHHKQGEHCHAATLYTLCAARTELWRPAVVPEELPLFAVDEHPVPPDPVVAVAAARAVATAVAAAGRRPGSVAPTPIPAPAAALLRQSHAKCLILDDDDEAMVTAEEGDGATPGAPPLVDGPGPPRRGGTAVGRAVHGVLQTVGFAGARPVPDDEVGALAVALAAAEGGAAAAATVAALARSALASGAVTEARAGRWWRELAISAPAGDRLVEGYVDLLYETDGGDLVVVDYKTDRLNGPDAAAAAVARYRLQAAAY